MNYLDIEGWFDDGVAKLYSEAAQAASPGDVLVEIGVCYGKSAAFLAEKLKLYGKESVAFHAVDVWTNYGQFLKFQRNIISCGLNSFIKPVRCSSSLAALQYKNESLSVVFIDADHRFEACRNDILSWFPKVKTGGLIGVHDAHLDSVAKAIDETIGFKNGEVWETTWIYRMKK